eukprot:scaffold134692_cov17-Prasinocladus_malaysianus.AAC.1
MGCVKLLEFQGEGLVYRHYVWADLLEEEFPSSENLAGLPSGLQLVNSSGTIVTFAALGCALRALLEPKTQTEMRAALSHLESNGAHSADSMVLLTFELASVDHPCYLWSKDLLNTMLK